MRVGTDTKRRAAALLEKSGIGVREAAKRIGTSYSTLWNFLYGKTENFGKLQQLADVLGVSLYHLTTGAFADHPTRRAKAAESIHNNTAYTPPPDEVAKMALLAQMEGKDPQIAAAEFISRRSREMLQSDEGWSVIEHNMRHLTDKIVKQNRKNPRKK